MSVKTTKQSKSKTEEPQFPYEFLDMLTDTAEVALQKHLEKTKASKDVARMIDIICVLFVEQTILAMGGAQRNDSLPQYVTEVIQLITRFGGEWHTANGSVTPLKEWREILAEKATT